MSSDGVILQHRTKLIAHLFVDRSDNLLIGNHIKSLSPTTGNRNLLRPGVNVWTDSGQAALFATPISLQVLYPSLSSLTAIELFSDDYHSTCFLAGYRSLVISNPAINRHHPSSLRVRSVQVRDYLNSTFPTSRLTFV
jgi:hypothetical protein